MYFFKGTEDYVHLQAKYYMAYANACITHIIIYTIQVMKSVAYALNIVIGGIF